MKPTSLILGFLIVFFLSCKKNEVSTSNLHFDFPQYDWTGTFYDSYIRLKWKDDVYDSYSVKIYSGNSENGSLVVNVLVDTNIYHHYLEPGDYFASVKKMSTSEEITVTFNVSNVTDLSNGVVDLGNPGHNSYMNPYSYVSLGQPYYYFGWSSHYSAEQHVFTIKEGADFNSSNIIVYTDTVQDVHYSPYSNTFVNNSLALDTGIITEEGIYSWGLKAINHYSSTEYSSNSFSVDMTFPQPVVLLSPSGTVSAGDVIFNWNVSPDIGAIQSPITHQIQISQDPNFNSFTGYVGGHDMDNSDTLTIAPGTYFWRIWTSDGAANRVYSSSMTFTAN